MPRGVPQLEVTYELDANGILTVSACEKSTNKVKNITITNDKGRLSKEQVEEMIKKADQLKEEDEKNFKRVEAKNSFESYVFNWRNQLDNKELVSKLTEEDVTQSKKLVSEAQSWLEANTLATAEEYEHKQKELETHFNGLAQKMYSQAGGEGEMPAGMPGMPGGMPGGAGMPDMAQFAEMMKGMNKGGAPAEPTQSAEEVD
jgi:heat shock protein 1/8